MEGTPARTQSPAPAQPVQNAPVSTPPGSARELFDATLAELLERGARVPLATYRVQLHAGFTFRQARAVVDYLHRLGVSDLYASPFFRARPESTHGYDLVDHNALSPAIGSERDFDELTRALARHGTGVLLDFVPNHMGIGTPDNAWWRDVLEHGPSSLYAGFFDIDWHPLKPELRHKVLLPVLGDHYGRVLEAGHLQLDYEAGALQLRVYDKTLPVNPGSYPLVLASAVASAASELGEEHESVLELQSILTGLRNLPPRAETSRARRVERRREAAVLKRRLDALVAQEPAVARAVAESVKTFNGTPGEAGSFRLLDALLEQQAYRLSYWRVAAEEINYRRFFDINDLAAIKMENPAVFSQAHRMVFELLYEGGVTALRIDHPDGLWDPVRYFSLLQRGFFLTLCRRKYLAGVSLTPPASGSAGGSGDRESLSPWPPAFPDRDGEARFAAMVPELERLYDDFVAREPGSPAARPLYLTVEKILSRGETLPAAWPVHGTVGYEVANLITGVFVDPASERAMTEAYRSYAGANGGEDFDTLVYEKKKLILQTSLASELNVLTAALNRLSEADWYSRDFTLGSLNHALREVIACFPVYRTYVNERTEALDAHDRAAVERAVRLARRRNPTTDASIFKFLRSILALEVPAWVREEQRPAWREFVMRFQQLTGPVMAKGLEDTAFYIYNRLVALNEVGGEPERYGTTLEQFHRANAERLASYPHSMCATSTHDTKRSEDVRARICVLSELPDRWERAVQSFSEANRDHRTDFEGFSAPDRNEEYLFFQTVLGSLPFGELRGAELEDYRERLVGYMRKATKEAKVNTSWINADPEYDAAVENYVRKALSEDSAFLREARAGIGATVAFHGMWAALSQVLLKYCAPGVPDTYQGNELWDFSLVDPDNRRPVDYALRARLLDEVEKRAGEGAGYARELVECAQDGRVKLFVTYTALQARRRLPGLFGAEGGYQALGAEGARAGHVVAFARARGDRALVVLAPRWTAKLAGGGMRAPLGELWGDTRVAVPAGRYRDLFTGREFDGSGGTLELASVFGEFPLGLLERV